MMAVPGSSSRITLAASRPSVACPGGIRMPVIVTSASAGTIRRHRLLARALTLIRRKRAVSQAQIGSLSAKRPIVRRYPDRPGDCDFRGYLALNFSGLWPGTQAWVWLDAVVCPWQGLAGAVAVRPPYLHG